MTPRMPAVLSALLFTAAVVGSLGAGYWLVAVIWLPAALALLSLRHRLLGLRMRPVWLGVLLVAVVACPLLAFEGGYFVLPAAVALLLADVFDGVPARRGRLATGRR